MITPIKKLFTKILFLKLLICVFLIYILFWGMTKLIYESKNSKIQTKFHLAITELNSNLENKDYTTLISCQYMKSPTEPEIFKPYTIFSSLFGAKDYDYKIIEEVKSFIEERKTKLYEVDLRNANLSGSNLSRANLMGTNLNSANLTNVNLSEAYLVATDLSNSNLSGTSLNKAVVINTDFRFANLNKVNLSSSTLGIMFFKRKGAPDEEMYLTGKTDLSNKQINQIESIYNAYFEDNTELLNKIKRVAPKKLEETD